MQHVPICWERQSDGTEYKKTLRRPGLCPGPRWGSLQRSRKPPSGGGCPLPKNPIPHSRPFGPRLFYPIPKLDPTPMDPPEEFDPSCPAFIQGHALKVIRTDGVSKIATFLLTFHSNFGEKFYRKL